MTSYEGHPDDEFLGTIKLNLFSLFLLAKTLLPLLRQAASADNPARIINIASLAGCKVASQRYPAYMSSNAGLIHLTKDMAQKFAQYNITVNSISPGPFDSQMLRDVTTEEEYTHISDVVPLRRLGNTKDITGTVVFLASDAGSFITGTDTALDGGVFIMP
ncbi:hypothetical protein EC988_000485 [Linderina pennispora]|nr:hypothetical protein EC988_000485 [Linderina pennispora]